MIAPTLADLNAQIREITYDARVDVDSHGLLWLRTDQGQATTRLLACGSDFVAGPAHRLGLNPIYRQAIARAIAAWRLLGGQAKENVA